MARQRPPVTVMMPAPRAFLAKLAALALLLASAPIMAKPAAAALGPIALRTVGLERQAGFLPLYFDGRRGQLLLELGIGRLGEDLLYGTGLTGGAGVPEAHLD